MPLPEFVKAAVAPVNNPVNVGLAENTAEPVPVVPTIFNSVSVELRTTTESTPPFPALIVPIATLPPV